jgi:Ca2+-binding EF-hand superfamily protein
VTLEQYWHYFNVAEESPQRAPVEAMFHARDKDGNGMLTEDEIEEMLSYDDVMVSG